MGNRVSIPDRPLPLQELLSASSGPFATASVPAKHTNVIAAWRFPGAIPITGVGDLTEFTPSDAFIIVRVYDPVLLRNQPCPVDTLNRTALTLCLSGVKHLNPENIEIPLNPLNQIAVLNGATRLRYRIYAWTGRAISTEDRCTTESKAFELVKLAEQNPVSVLGRLWLTSTHVLFPSDGIVALEIVQNPIFMASCCDGSDNVDCACRKQKLQLDLAGIMPISYDSMPKSPPKLSSTGLSEEQQKLALLDIFTPQSSLIEPNLFLSGEAVSQDLNHLASRGITHIVNAALDACRNAFPERFTYLGLRLSDSKHEDIICRVYDVIDFIETALAKPHHKVLVHCHRGISRSATLVIAYLMVKRSLSFQAAFDLVKARRDIISPNIGFSVALIQWHRRLQAGAGDAPVLYRITSFSPERDPLCIVAKITDVADARFDSRAVFVLQTVDRVYIWIGTCTQRLLYAYARQTLVPRLQRFEHARAFVADEHDGSESAEFRALLGRPQGSSICQGCLRDYDAEYNALALPLQDRLDPVADHRSGALSHRPSSSAPPPAALVSSHSERDHVDSEPLAIGPVVPSAVGEDSGDVAAFYNWPYLNEIEVFGPEDLHDSSVFVFVKRRSRSRSAKLYIWAGAEVDLGPDSNEFVATIAKDCIGRLGMQGLEITIIYEEAGDESDDFWDLF